jgi:hypothetical protein
VPISEAAILGANPAQRVHVRFNHHLSPFHLSFCFSTFTCFQNFWQRMEVKATRRLARDALGGCKPPKLG